MNKQVYKDAHILWQKDPEDGVAEKPILVEVYNDLLCISQEDNSVNLNYDSIDELCKLLKKLKQ